MTPERSNKEFLMDKSEKTDSVESVEIAGISEPSAGDAPEVTANAQEGEGKAEHDQITDEIELRLKAVGALLISSKRISALLATVDEKNTDSILRIVRPMCVQIENVLPVLREFVDDLDAVGEQDKALEVRKALGTIEDDLLPKVLEFLNRHPVKHDPIDRN